MDLHSYYLDESVGNLDVFQQLFERAQLLAARALQRLADRHDVEFARVFELIFKTPVWDTEAMPRCPRFRPTHGRDRDNEMRPLYVASHVARELRSFATNWRRTFNREQAAVRIHWDGQRRYVQSHGSAEIKDPVNHMVLFESRDEMERARSKSLAYVIPCARPWYPNLQLPVQNPRRNVMDFTENARKNQTMLGYWAEARLHGRHVDEVMYGLLETTLIHEIMHCEAHGLIDFCTDRRKTGGWNLIMGRTKQESYICAESIAMLCFAAALADLQPVDLPKGFRYTISGDGIITAYSGNTFVAPGGYGSWLISNPQMQGQWHWGG